MCVNAIATHKSRKETKQQGFAAHSCPEGRRRGNDQGRSHLIIGCKARRRSDRRHVDRRSKRDAIIVACI